MLNNEAREAAAIVAGNLLPYEGLVTPYPVWAAVFACGIERTLDEYKDVATGLFQNDYETCIDLNDRSLYNYHKTAAAQPAVDGNQLIHTVPQRSNIRAFVQWTKDKIRTGQDPAMFKFRPTGIAKILRKAETHKLYVENSASHAVKPRDFTKEIKWADWAPSFENYLRAIPGRIGVPLSYVIREDDSPDPNLTLNEDFLDDYILNAPLSGADYMTDRRAVHTKLVALISTNPDAEALIKLNEKNANGRKDWKDLKFHYEGKGMFAIDLNEAKQILRNLTYKGESPPHEYWDKFERQLNTAFATYVKVEKRIVHSDSMKLTHLLDVVNCNKLVATTAAIHVAIGTSSAYSYKDAIRAYKTEVAKNNATAPNQREVKEQSQGGRGRGRGGRGYGRGRGYGSSGRGRDGRGYSGRDYQNVPKTVDGSTFFNLSDGTRIEYHPSIDFPPETYSKFTSEQKDMLTYDRANGTVSPNLKNGFGGHSSKRKIQQLEQQNWDLQSQLQSPPQVPEQQIPAQVGNSTASQVSQVTQQEGSVMGGRADQARMRQVQSNNSNNNQGRGDGYSGYGGYGRYNRYGGRGGGRG